jgi:hypothetical protein
MLKLDVLAAELNLWANETEQIYRATKEIKYRRDTTHLRYLAATLNQSSLPSAGVTQIVAGTNVTISPASGTGVVTINASGGGAVDSIIAGTNISISPAGGTGNVTINATTLNPEPTGYGSFYSNVSQPITTINTPQAVTLGQTYEAVGTSTSGSRIYMDKAGTYQFSYVAQVASSANSQEYAEFWIKYNGVTYPNSGTKMILQPRKSSTEPSEQLMTLIINGTSLNDNDYIELFWEATSTEVSLKYDPASGSYPATPSIIANIIPIGAQGRDSNLNELNDVLITTPSTGQLLRIDSDGLWKNWTPNFLTTVPTLDQVVTAGNSVSNNGITITRASGATLTLNPGASDNAIVINNSGFIKFTTGADSFIRGSSTAFSVLDASYVSKVQFHWGGSASWINTGGNLLIGTTTDAGYKLDVNGTARVSGTIRVGSTFNGTLATLADFRGASDANFVQIARETDTNRGVKIYASGMIIASSIETSGAAYSFLNNVSGSASSGNRLFFNISGGWAPTSGTASWDQVRLNPTINTTGTYAGIVRGIYYNPTLTSLTGTTHRAIETTSGDVLLGTTSGNVGIGTTNPLYKLHVSATAGDIVYIIASTGQSAVIGATGSGTNRMYIGYSPGGENISITSSGVVRLNSITSGNVLIGTTTDLGNKLEVSGTVNATAYKINNVIGYTGILNIPTNPPGSQNLDIQGGIIVNVF